MRNENTIHDGIDAHPDDDSVEDAAHADPNLTTDRDRGEHGKDDPTRDGEPTGGLGR